jgi:hypothetical protein
MYGVKRVGEEKMDGGTRIDYLHRVGLATRDWQAAGAISTTSMHEGNGVKFKGFK